ncbi:MAG: MBG domain-containing protein, partial [Isosphaeraceae bacterium]
DASASVPGTFAYSPPAGSILPAGAQTVSVTFTPTDHVDYSPVTATVTLQVNPATLAVTANPASMTYGGSLPTLSYTITGLDGAVPGPGVISGTPALSTTASASSSPGSYPIAVDVSGMSAANYTFVGQDGTLTVGPATPAVTWAAPAAITYGTPLGSAQLDASASVPGTFAYSPPAGSILPAGAQTVSVTFTPSDTTDYATTTASVVIDVTPALLTVTASDASMSYGGPLPTLSDTITGFVAGDGPGVITGTSALSTTASASSAPGSYPIAVDVSGMSAANYTFVGQDGTLTVGPAAPTVTWPVPAAITYGTPLGSAQLDATASVAGTFAYSPSAGTVLDAGSQTLSVTFSPTDTADFSPVTATVTLQVNPATLTVTADPIAVSYGAPLPTLPYTITGFQAGDGPGVVSGTPTLATTASADSPPGSYPVVVDVSGMSAPNYTIQVQDPTATGQGQNGTLTVAPATPTVTWAAPAAITYGTPLGAAQLDATTSVAGTFAYSLRAGTILPAGKHTLSVTFTPTDTADYVPTTATMTLVVNPAALLVAASPVTRVYGQENPAFSVTYAGLTNGDLPSSLGGSLDFSTTATAASPVGTYRVVPGGLASPNYVITYAGANLVVTPAPLTIGASDQSRAYGDPNSPLVAYYQGFVNGDTPSSLMTPVTLSAEAVPASFVGSYPIVAGGATSPNYTIHFVSGTLTVVPPSQPIIRGRMAFVSRLYQTLLLRAPGPYELFYWVQQLGAHQSPRSVATSIYRSPAHRAVLRSHHGVGIGLTAAFRSALRAEHQAIKAAQQPGQTRSHAAPGTVSSLYQELLAGWVRAPR